MNPYILKLIRKNLIVFAITFFALLFVEYVIIGIHFRKHFYDNTFINGVDCSNLTAFEAQELIKQQVGSYSLMIRGRDGLAQIITGDSIGLAYRYQHGTKKLLKKQRPYFWLFNAFRTHDIEDQSEITYNGALLNKLLDQICYPGKKKVISPKNAQISSYNKKTGFTIKKEVVGNELDRSLVGQCVARSIQSLSTQLSLEGENCYKKPSVVSTSPGLKSAIKTINKYMSTKLTYQFGGKTEVFDKDQIGPAIVVDQQNQVHIREELVLDFVKHLSKTYDNPKGTWKFHNSYGKQVAIRGGQFGWILDEKKELKEVLACIKDGKQMVKQPVPSSNSVNQTYRTLGNTYVEINKTNQHLFYYKNGKLLLECDVVTGILKGGHDTPVGLYYVSQKQRNRVLRGFNDDGSKYAAFVRYWMRFNGGIGLHDAPWQPYFGRKRYIYAGSHGCVNMPSKAAEKLYGMIELYTPVVVYW